MAKFSFKKNINIGRVIGKIVTTILTLWVGSMVIESVAVAMNQTESIFTTGLEFIGFGTTSGTLNGTVSTTGILSIIGIVAVASIVMEFVTVRL